jgi:hypothetical protein
MEAILGVGILLRRAHKKCPLPAINEMTMNTIEAVSVSAGGPAMLRLSKSLDNASTALARSSASACVFASPERVAAGDLGKRIQIATSQEKTEDTHNSP